MNKLSKLNTAQLKAVKSSVEQHCIVSAPPGTGKTKVFIERIKYLIANGYHAQNILALTFSVRTVEDIKDKLKESKLKVQANTFHSFASRVLRNNHAEAGLQKNYQIIEPYEQQLVIKELLTELKVNLQTYPIETVQNYINERKQIALQFIPVLPSDTYNEQLRILYEYYEAYCHQSNLMDFTGLLIGVCNLFDKNPAILSQYQSQYPHILCDEYHDVEPLQVKLLQKLTSKNRSKLFALADKYQTIYGFRGSDLDYTINFYDYFPISSSNSNSVSNHSSKAYQLTESYRSGQNILNVANAVVLHCKLTHGRTSKIPKLRSVLGKNYNYPVYIYEAQTDTEESDFVVSQIKYYIQNNKLWSGDLSQIAVLYRNNNQAEFIESALKANNIEYQIRGNKREEYYNRIEIKDLVAYLQIIENPKNNHALKRIINKPARRIGKKTMQVLQGTMASHKLSLWESINFVLTHPTQMNWTENNLTGNKATNSKLLNALNNFASLVNQLRLALSNSTDSFPEIVERIIKQSGLYKYYQNQANKNQTSTNQTKNNGQIKVSGQVESLNKLVQIAEDYEYNNPNATLTDFLTHISLLSESENERKQSVQLMTLHGCKGLQFEIVFIIGVHENKLPFKTAIERGLEAIEEERRLFYVGVTRARKHLCLSYSTSGQIGMRLTKNQMSRFIEEIPQYLLTPIQSFQIPNSIFAATNDSDEYEKESKACHIVSIINKEWLNARQVSERFNITERNAQKALSNAYHRNMAWRSVYLKVRINKITKAYEVHKESLPPVSDVVPIFQVVSSEQKNNDGGTLPNSILSDSQSNSIILPENSEKGVITDVFPIHRKDVMVDWITIYQEFSHELPKFNDGQIICLDSEGEVKWTTLRKFSYEGSHSSKIAIWTNGKTLYASGNFGRFDREENILNYGLLDTIIKINNLLHRKEFNGLPEFSIGIRKTIEKTKSGRYGKWTELINIFNGAQVMRLDIMRNYSFKTEEELKDWLYYVSQIHIPYVRDSVKYPKSSNRIEAVIWGEGSKDYSLKVYDKATELAYHNRKKMVEGSYLKQCYEYLKDNHILRIESSLKYRLTRMNAKSIGNLLMWREKVIDKTDVFYNSLLSEFYEEKSKILLSDLNKVNNEHLIKNKTANLLYLNWISGNRVSTLYKERTIRKHAKFIKEVMGPWADINKPPPKSPNGSMKITMPTLAPPPGDFYKMPRIKELESKEESKVEQEILEAPQRREQEMQDALHKMLKQMSEKDKTTT